MARIKFFLFFIFTTTLISLTTHATSHVSIDEALKTMKVDIDRSIEDTRLSKFIQQQIDELDNKVDSELAGYRGPTKILSQGGYQEAVWLYKDLGYDKKSKQLKKALTKYLKTAPIQIKNRELGTRAVDGMTEVFIGDLPGAMKAYWKPKNVDWHSRYEHELAAYMLDQHWELDLVPITVERNINGEVGSLQLGVHLKTAHLMGKDFYPIRGKLLIFDYLLQNTDRHLKNFGYLTNEFYKAYGYRLVAIDHSISFYRKHRGLLGHKKGIVPPPTLQSAKNEYKSSRHFQSVLIPEKTDQLYDILGKYISKNKIKAVIARIEALTKE